MLDGGSLKTIKLYIILFLFLSFFYGCSKKTNQEELQERYQRERQSYSKLVDSDYDVATVSGYYNLISKKSFRTIKFIPKTAMYPYSMEATYDVNSGEIQLIKITEFQNGEEKTYDKNKTDYNKEEKLLIKYAEMKIKAYIMCEMIGMIDFNLKTAYK